MRDTSERGDVECNLATQALGVGRNERPARAETVESFEAIVKGELDEVPEQAFLNVGSVEQVLAKAKALQESAS
ncbi:MAG: hypothetical protein ACKOI3_05635 [Actinomycetota bacterium]